MQGLAAAGCELVSAGGTVTVTFHVVTPPPPLPLLHLCRVLLLLVMSWCPLVAVPRPLRGRGWRSGRWRTSQGSLRCWTVSERGGRGITTVLKQTSTWGQLGLHQGGPDLTQASLHGVMTTDNVCITLGIVPTATDCAGGVCAVLLLSLPPGRVKTLHPGVHGGILAIRGNPAHMEAIKQHNIQPIDLVRHSS